MLRDVGVGGDNNGKDILIHFPIVSTIQPEVPPDNDIAQCYSHTRECNMETLPYILHPWDRLSDQKFQSSYLKRAYTNLKYIVLLIL